VLTGGLLTFCSHVISEPVLHYTRLRLNKRNWILRWFAFRRLEETGRMAVPIMKYTTDKPVQLVPINLDPIRWLHRYGLMASWVPWGGGETGVESRVESRMESSLTGEMINGRLKLNFRSRCGLICLLDSEIWFQEFSELPFSCISIWIELNWNNIYISMRGVIGQILFHLWQKCFFFFLFWVVWFCISHGQLTDRNFSKTNFLLWRGVFWNECNISRRFSATISTRRPTKLMKRFELPSNAKKPLERGVLVYILAARCHADGIIECVTDEIAWVLKLGKWIISGPKIYFFPRHEAIPEGFSLNLRNSIRNIFREISREIFSNI